MSQERKTTMAALERKNIEDLTAPELASYEHAMRKLIDNTDPNTNYQRHADFHNVFGSNPPRGCEHRNDLFFPWHRYHLLNFERALQVSDPDHPSRSTRNVTIPYWDWTASARTGQRYPAAFENPSSPLFQEERNAEPSGPIFDADYMTDIVRNNSDWNVFAGGPKNENEFFGVFENPSHNDMHSEYIGGLMGHPFTAAEDPIYWSFHAFIDRLWERWHRIHGKRPTCLECTLRAFPSGPKAGHVERTETQVDLGEGNLTLGYFYSFRPEETQDISALRTAEPAVITAASREERETLHVLQQVGSSLIFKLPTLDTVPRRAALWLVEVIPPVRQSCRVSVFLHPPSVDPSVADGHARNRYHIGDFSFWKAHHLLPGQTAGAVLEVTTAIRQYADEGAQRLLTLVPKFLPDEVDGGHHHHDEEPRGQLRFHAIALQVDGDGIPNLHLGGVPQHEH
jgi:hypothetical protein